MFFLDIGTMTIESVPYYVHLILLPHLSHAPTLEVCALKFSLDVRKILVQGIWPFTCLTQDVNKAGKNFQMRNI